MAALLDHLRGTPLVILGLPRGGVPVAREVASALGAPLDVIAVRKLGVPFDPEFAMGAIGEDGVRVIDQRVVEMVGVSEADIVEVERRERAVLAHRIDHVRRLHPRLPLEGVTAVVVDDGIATGSTARAACAVARAHGAARVVLAVPVAPAGWADGLRDTADEYVAVEEPAGFRSVGQFYDDFGQTTDAEVLAALATPA